MKKSTLFIWLATILGVANMFVLFLPAVSTSGLNPEYYSVYSMTFNEYNPRGGLVTAWAFLVAAVVFALLALVLRVLFDAKSGSAYVGIASTPFFTTSCVLYFCTQVFANKGPQYHLSWGGILGGSFSFLAIVCFILAAVFTFIENKQASETVANA